MTPVLDTLKNLVTGLGTSKDRTTTTSFVFVPKTDAELINMHRSDWLSKKIVNIIPHDMTREWRDWQAKKDQIEAIEKVEKHPRINVAAKITLAMQKARLFGGAAIFIGIKGQDPEEPLDLNRVGKDSLEYLALLHRYEVSIGPLIQDVTDPLYGEPEYYQVTGKNGTTVKVHPSRMVRLIGDAILDDRLVSDPGWGDSVLQGVYDAVQNASSMQQHVAALVPEAKTDVIYMPGLSKILENTTTTNQLTSRFTYANTAKSAFNMLLLEGNGGTGDNALGEKWEQKQINFSQLPELTQQFLQIVAGAADIPVTRLLGQSPAGLNSTGDGDLHNYYDNISARQRMELTPAMHRLDEVIIRSALGSRPEEIYFEWSPLYSLSEKEQAEVFKTIADAARAIVGNGGTSEPIIPPEAISDGLVNAIVEGGFLPGLDAAIEEFGRLSEQEEENPEELEAAMLPPAAQAQEAQDAAPRTLYIHRKVLNARDIVSWAKEQGFETTIPAEDLHVTIIHTRTPLDWIKVGQAGEWSSEDDGKMTIAPGGPRLMERFGEAVVLQFASTRLAWRHEDIKRLGAATDFPEYQPHITISWNAAGVDLTKVEPYKGKIELGPEQFEEVNDDWKSGVAEE